MWKRWIFALLLAAACGDNDQTTPDIDAAPEPACAPSGGCTEGPACGAGCCGVGERCVDNVCKCGDGPACPAGDTCQPFGPIGTDNCGSICCGSGPCPQ